MQCQTSWSPTNQSYFHPNIQSTYDHWITPFQQPPWTMQLPQKTPLWHICNTHYQVLIQVKVTKLVLLMLMAQTKQPTTSRPHLLLPPSMMHATHAAMTPNHLISIGPNQWPQQCHPIQLWHSYSPLWESKPKYARISCLINSAPSRPPTSHAASQSNHSRQPHRPPHQPP